LTWLLNLQETYDANIKEVGNINKNRFNREYALIPVAHTTQNAHIEVNVTGEGEFHSAMVVEKDDASTLIPSTVDSASRAGAVVSPYPLHDKLMYTAGDFSEYGGKIGKKNPFEAYIEQLEQWVLSPYGNDKLRAIYSYLKKGQLISDLVKEKILFLDGEGKLIKRWNKKYDKLHEERPRIFSVVAGDQGSAFVRFNVYSPNEILTKPWRDKEMFNSFINFYERQVGNEDVCYVTGEVLPSTDKHANKIRHAADKAKLISGNDTRGFTFRGKFNKSDEVASISYNASQKAHNALKWLIEKQGRVIDNRVFLIWGNNTLELPDLQEDSFHLGGKIDEDISLATTNSEYAAQFSKAIDGYKHNLKFESNINILVIDSATTGRMAVLYYRNLDKDLYFERLKDWHTSCVWLHRYVKNDKNEWIEFIGAPATKDIAFAAYGPKADEKIVKGLMERMLPSILEGREIPQDIIFSAFHRASNPVSMERWEWEKTLTVACSLINKKERLDVGLDKNNDDRDYLFGRLLAVADVLERSAMDSEESRSTNAIRYMNSFSNHPARTWNTIQDSIQPYQARLGKRATYYTKIIDEIGSKIKIEDFNDKPLSGKYLLGMYSQRHELYKKKDKEENKKE